jgi:GT2 family glycosyltransferase
MRIGIVLVVYSEYPTLVFDSIIGKTVHELEWYIHCHSADQNIEQRLVAFCQSNRCDLRLHRRNRGLARSWNDGILTSYHAGRDFTLVINDDICFRPGAFDAFISFLMDRPAFALGFLHGEEPAYNDEPSIIRSQDFACFAIGILAYLNVGAFDENFFPAYSEDVDYTIRIRNLNLLMITDTRVLVDHERSKTFKRSPEIRATIEAIGHANNAYLVRKWGWTGNSHTFDEQFNTHGCFIAWDRRRAPFGPGVDRPDLPVDRAPAVHLQSGIATEGPALHDPTARHGAVCGFVVQAIYRSLLCRDAEPGAIERYAGEFVAGTWGLTDFSDAVRQSPEYENRTRLTTANKRRVLIQYGHGPEHGAFLDVIEDLHRSYCARHGIDYWARREPPTPGRSAHWMKVALLREAMNAGYSQAIWLDTDCVIINHDYNLFDASGFGIAVCECFDSPSLERHLNTGIVIVTRSAEVEDFLADWDAAPPGGIWEDQSGFIELMRHRPNRDLLTVLPNRFNCLDVHMEARNPIVRAFHGEPKRRVLLPALVANMRH